MNNSKSPGLDGFTVEFFKKKLDWYWYIYIKIGKPWVQKRFSKYYTEARGNYMLIKTKQIKT